MGFRILGKVGRHGLQISLMTGLNLTPLLGKSSQVFDISKAPNQRTWKAFFAYPEKTRKDLWHSKQQQGFQLRNWAWQWRLAWIRTCARSQELYCGEIMSAALQDPALVVRAESASLIGQRFAGTGNPQALQLLKEAFYDKRNLRDGKAMFIQYRILSAIYEISPEDTELFEQLSQQSAETESFAKRLHRSSSS